MKASSRHHAVENDVGVEAALNQVQEVEDGIGRLIGPHAELDLAERRVEDDVLVGIRPDARVHRGLVVDPHDLAVLGLEACGVALGVQKPGLVELLAVEHRRESGLTMGWSTTGGPIFSVPTTSCAYWSLGLLVVQMAGNRLARSTPPFSTNAVEAGVGSPGRYRSMCALPFFPRVW